MAKRILISVDPYEARAALLDGDRLANVEMESSGSHKRKGNLYRGKVTAVETNLEAAFVDYGVAKDGFLPFSDVTSRSLSELTGHDRGKTRSGLRVGDPVLVQVTKEEVGKKGAALTMNVSLPGRFTVLMPFSDRTGVSRKLDEEERSRLRHIKSQLKLPEGYGAIIRTSGERERLEEIQADLDHLLMTWEALVQRFKKLDGTGEVHVESGLAERFVRDYLAQDVSEILVEDDQSWKELTRYVEQRMPQRRQQLKRYAGDMPLFLKFGVERQIDALLNARVSLPSGGSIVIGLTEALVAIDVNSGRSRQKEAGDMALQTNLEAAREIARQVVLRDLGGIIVVDFIDMETPGHNRQVEEELAAAFTGDKARLSFGHITDFGLLPFSRQRIRQSVDSGVTLACPTCNGAGRVRSPAILAMSALRRVQERLATQTAQSPAYVAVQVPVQVANFLNNRKREDLVALERRYDVMVDVLGDEASAPDGLKVSVLPEVPSDRMSLRHAVMDEDDDTNSAEVTPRASPAIPEPSREAREPERERSLLGGLLRRVFGIGLEPEVEVVEAPVVARPAPSPAPQPAPRNIMAPREPAAPAALESPEKASTPMTQTPPSASSPRPSRRRGGRGRGPRKEVEGKTEEAAKPTGTKERPKAAGERSNRRRPRPAPTAPEATATVQPAPAEAITPQPTLLPLELPLGDSVAPAKRSRRHRGGRRRRPEGTATGTAPSGERSEPGPESNPEE